MLSNRYFGEANDDLQGALRETLLLNAPISRRFLDVLLRKLTVNLVYYQSEPSVVVRVRPLSAKLLFCVLLHFVENRFDCLT